MEGKARLTDVSRDLRGKYRLTFTFESDVSRHIDEIADTDLSLKAVKWRNKRSLNANAYFYALATKIAEAVKSSLTEVHNKLIADYGYMDENLRCIIMRDDIAWEKVAWMHLRPTTKTRVMDDGQTYRIYIVMRGSHIYNTKEMSRLIDGTIAEAQALGIETITPEEKERMLRAWEQNQSYKKTKSALSADGPKDSTNITSGTAQPTGRSQMKTDL